MFSQHDEEKCILENTPPGGRFLDCGAWSGTVFSNSRALALKGWSGVCVEPSPGPFKALVDLYKTNEKIVLINALIGLGGYGLKKFYSTDDAISTTDTKNCEKWGGVKNFREIYTPEIPIGVLYDFGPFNFVSIDCEGTSVDIMKAFNFLHAGTSLVCVEHDGRIDEVTRDLEARRFRVIYQNGTNIIGKRI